MRSQRGPEGGFWLARPASEISLADIIRAIDGPLVGVRGERPEKVGYSGAAEPLQTVWIALRANERAILEEVTLEDIVTRQSSAAGPRTRRGPAGMGERAQLNPVPCQAAQTGTMSVTSRIRRATSSSKAAVWPGGSCTASRTAPRPGAALAARGQPDSAARRR